MHTSEQLETFPGLKIIPFKMHADQRGSFTKVFDKAAMQSLFKNEICEIFFSESKKGVIRGLHFQTPPTDHDKFVFCLKGRVYDLVLDLRQGSPSYGRFFPIELSATSGQALLIPKGFAHGFQALEDDSLLGYLVSSAYSPEHDQGLLWSSATWPLPPTFISERDKKFPSFNEFKTPFLYKTP